MDVASLCLSTVPEAVPAKEAQPAVVVVGNKREEAQERRCSQQTAGSVALPHDEFDSNREVVAEQIQSPCSAEYFPIPSRSANPVPTPPPYPMQLPPRTEGRPLPVLPLFPPTPLRHKDPSCRESFVTTLTDGDPVEQRITRDFRSGRPYHSESHLQEPRPTLLPLPPYAYNYAGGVYGEPQRCSVADMLVSFPPRWPEPVSPYHYGHGSHHQPGHLPFPSPGAYYGSLPAYQPCAEGNVDSTRVPGRRPSLPSRLTTFGADCNRTYENCTVIARFAAEMGDRARRDGSCPLPQPADLEIWELTLRAHDVLQTLAAMGGYPVPAFPLATRNTANSDGGVSRAAEPTAAAAIGTDEGGDDNPRPKYRKRKKAGNNGLTGSCHSCNVSETPEWRRGPDGARTLCNACGLHFAKLRRKQTLSEMKYAEQSKLIAAECSSSGSAGVPSVCHDSASRDAGRDVACPDTPTRQSVVTSNLPSAPTPAAGPGLEVGNDDDDGHLDRATVAGVPPPCKPESLSSPADQVLLGASCASTVVGEDGKWPAGPPESTVRALS